MRLFGSWLRVTGAMLALLLSFPARAVPVFARKYGTSCLTCHVIYPKLNPFGEAFRRNGYRFPGVDADQIKEPRVPLGQEAHKKVFPNAVWPASMSAAPPLGIGVEGQAVVHPDTSSGGAKEDDGAAFTLHELFEEAEIFAAGSLSESVTLYGILEFSADEVEVEHAEALLNDLAGPKHAVNAIAGLGRATLTSFGPHSSYLVRDTITRVPVTGLFGGSPSWRLLGNTSRVEVNGVLGGRFDYSIGLSAGRNLSARATEDVYAHAGYKLGGMRLDGEGKAAPAGSPRPWAEKSLTVDGFVYYSNSGYEDELGDPARDTAISGGVVVRGLLGSAELDVGFFGESHGRASPAAGELAALVGFGEVSYVVYPWLVPALRVESITLDPDFGDRVNDLRFFLGVDFLVRANVKATITALVERAGGAPPGGWGPSGGKAAPGSPTEVVDPEVESINLSLAWAF